MEEIFRIVTPRLELRPWRDGDRDAFTGFVRNSEMMRYITAGTPWDERQIDEFFARQTRNANELGYCMAAVVLRETGGVIGVAGIQPHRLVGDDEIGWWIGPGHQGQGFASEAGAACLHYGLHVLQRSRIVAIADPENAASIRVMQKIGMRYLDTVIARTLEARYPDTPVVRYVAEEITATRIQPLGRDM